MSSVRVEGRCSSRIQSDDDATHDDLIGVVEVYAGLTSRLDVEAEERPYRLRSPLGYWRDDGLVLDIRLLLGLYKGVEQVTTGEKDEERESE